MEGEKLVGIWFVWNIGNFICVTVVVVGVVEVLQFVVNTLRTGDADLRF